MGASLLIVDDDTAHRTMLKTIASGWGFTVAEANDGLVAVEKVKEGPYDGVLMDIRMVHMDGISALREIKQFNPSIPVLIMTAYSSVETAVDALKIGAYDYLTKPLDFDVLKHTLDRMLDHTRLASENQNLRDLLQAHDSSSSMVGNSAAMREVVEMVNTIAPSDATVLITGESGTGKELIARAIHQGSNRAAKSLVAVNCAALTETLLESELFGHERGAFTGADKKRDGRFVQADGGTIFLDEIGEMPHSLQAKLLRVLQQGEVQRVGSDMPVQVDVRIIAATNRNLLQEVAEGTFREDLYYRLNVIGVHSPALRERLDDVPLLAMYFLEGFAKKNRKSVKGFSPQAMDAMLRYDWPGNVRELENAVERSVIMTTSEYITPRELPRAISETVSGDVTPTAPSAASSDCSSFAGMSLEQLEEQAIRATLKDCDDNKSEAARRLGITRATLHNKIKRYGIE